MKIDNWWKCDEQWFQNGSSHWSVSRLIRLAKDLSVMDVPLDHLYTGYHHHFDSLQEMAMHVKAIHNADMTHPIILDQDGFIMDGRHRVMRAMLEGDKTIKAVRFEKTPAPCKIEE